MLVVSVLPLLAVGMLVLGTSDAFASPRRGLGPVFRIPRRDGRNGGDKKPPDPPRTNRFSFNSADDEGDDDGTSHIGAGRVLFAGGVVTVTSFGKGNPAHEKCVSNNTSSDITPLEIRGGGSIQKKLAQKKNDVIQGAKSAVEDTFSYWSEVGHFLTTPFRFFSGKKGTKRVGKAEREAMEQLEAVKVQAVVAPNSTLLPPDVVNSAAQNSGLLGGTLRPESVEECARQLRKWYQDRGYILNSVTGATLQAESASAELTVKEATVSSNPVDVIFAKEMVIDDATGEVMSFREYRRKIRNRGEGGAGGELNTTFVETHGKTKPATLARALGLKSGKPFKWNRNRWDRIAGSGIFSRVLSASPEQMDDGTVQFRVVATEAPSRNLEYGISKSIYNDAWEGEIELENSNLFGGGETIALMAKRGAMEPEPSFRFRFSGNKLGLVGGYDVEAFNDYIGVKERSNGNNLFSRKGMTVRVNNPIPTVAVRHSSTSASIEQTSTKTGEHDLLANVNLDVGPLYQNVLGIGRSNIQTSVTVGTHLDSRGAGGGKAGLHSFVPYSSYTATTRQVFPITSPDKSVGRSVELALQHSVFGSTEQLPRHEANAAGFAARVRGYSSRLNGPISSSVVGTAEIRIPIPIPSNKVVEECRAVLFGDWMLATQRAQSNYFRKSSIGVGLRNVIQGIPVKFDLSLTDDGKVGTHFSLGRDFDV